MEAAGILVIVFGAVVDFFFEYGKQAPRAIREWGEPFCLAWSYWFRRTQFAP
jgi:hypothetical protein